MKQQENKALWRYEVADGIYSARSIYRVRKEGKVQ